MPPSGPILDLAEVPFIGALAPATAGNADRTQDLFFVNADVMYPALFCGGRWRGCEHRMTWVGVYSGVSGDGDLAFTVDRRQTALPIRRHLKRHGLLRRRWRVRVWRSDPEDLLVEDTVRSTDAARDILEGFTLDWEPKSPAVGVRSF